MGTIYKVVSGIGALICLYLVLNNFTAATSIVDTIAKNSIKGIQVLQGRQVYMQ